MSSAAGGPIPAIVRGAALVFARGRLKTMSRVRCAGSIRIEMDLLLAAHLVRTHIATAPARPDMHLVGTASTAHESADVKAAVEFENGRVSAVVELGVCEDPRGGCSLCYQVTGYGEEEMQRAADVVRDTLAAHARFLQRD